MRFVQITPARSRFLESHHEGDAVGASVDVLAEFGIERDRSFQQKWRDGLPIEAAGAHERLIDGLQIALVLVESGANAVEITERRKKPQRARKQTLR